jgi:enolase
MAHQTKVLFTRHQLGKLGANAILPVSMALCQAAAASQKKPLHVFLNSLLTKSRKASLPLPFFNVLNGGQHAGNQLAFQEFMIVPIGAASFQEAMSIGCNVYHTLKSEIAALHGKSACNVGDEGGFAPPLRRPEEALDLIMQTIEKLQLQGKVAIALDIAASEFYQDSDGKYHLAYKWEDSHTFSFTPQAYLEYLVTLANKYPSKSALLIDYHSNLNRGPL